MFYLISTIPLEEISKNSQNIPSPLIIQHHTRKPVMLSTLTNDVHSIYMAYGQPVYAYVMKDDWFQKHLSWLRECHDTGVLNELPVLMEDYEKNKERIQRIYPFERLVAFPPKMLSEQIQHFGKTHSFKNADYYGFILENRRIREV